MQREESFLWFVSGGGGGWLVNGIREGEPARG